MAARVRPLLLAALLLDAASASAQVGIVFTRTGSGARAAGMANAFIAISDDGSAASWNPAGLAQLRKPELSLVTSTAGRSLSGTGFRTRDDLSTFTPVRSSYQASYLDFASLAVPVRIFGKPVTFQGGWRRLYSLDYRENVAIVREPVTADGPPAIRIVSNTDLTGSVDLISVAGAIKLTPRLAFGSSFNMWRGDWSEEAAASEAPVSGAGLPAFGMIRQQNRIRGDNFSVGLLLTYPRWSVGLLHQSPVRSDYSNDVTASLSGAAPQSRRIEGSLSFPRAFGAGGAWRPGAHWTVALDLTWDDWDGAVFDTPETGKVNLFDELPADRTSTRDTLSLNAGAERLFVAQGFVIPLRFGAAYEPQGSRSPYTRDPVNYRMLAVGTGYNTNSLKFDAAFQYRWASAMGGADFGLAPSQPLLPSAVGERGAKDWRLKLSVILRLTDTEKLHRTVHKVFAGS